MTAIERRVLPFEARATETSSLAIELVADEARAGATWRQIEARIDPEALTASWLWTHTWLRHYGDQIWHRFVVGSDTSGPCAIALITRGSGQKRGPLPVRTIHIGTAGEPESTSVCVEFNRLLVAPHLRAAFADGLLRIIERQGRHWDICELNGFAPDDAEVLARLQPELQLHKRLCYVADLDLIRASGSDVATALSRSVTAKLRKNIRRFEERFGPITTEWIETSGRALEVYDELVELHQQRWTSAGHSGSFADSRFRGFHRDLIAAWTEPGKVLLYRAKAGEQVIGTFYGFVERGVLYHYQWGLAQFDDNSLSPGFVVGALCMQAALERGYHEVNWLAGDIRYKRELSTASRELVWGEWHRGAWAFAIDTMIRGKHRFARTNEQVIKEPVQA